ncbi:MAG: sulfurtransferase [Euryarchaeota archaeon]|nr:sulfurtransferase [Euryarchaeota archaeon]
MVENIVNIAGYRFVDLPDRDELREPFKSVCDDFGLLGTILLSHEGINFFLSGSQSSIDLFIEYLEKDLRFINIPLKISYSERMSFRRMNVRLKKEIISLGLDSIRPSESTGESISPSTFKSWLDEGREIVVLDTRNDYEVRLGTFEGAVGLNLSTFRAFPDAIAKSEIDKNQTVVMFCTGGIRCEKASSVMMQQGWSDVRQLEGGILGYFEEVGGEHWNGDCFVFDRRVAVDPALEETTTQMCWACREPLTEEEMQSEQYEIARSCPYCIEETRTLQGAPLD